MSLINTEYAEEVKKLEEFAAAGYSEQKSAEIFRTEDKASYYLDSEEVRRFPDVRMIEYGFANPMQLEQMLKKIWADDEEMKSLIPAVKVATFKMKDKYENKFKDLSLYNYTL